MTRRSASDASFLRGLVVLALGAALLRAVHLWLQAQALPFLGHPVLDAAVYHEWARSITEGRTFSPGPYYQSPGYPHFLAAVYALAGARPMAAVLVQCVLGVATVVLTALLGRRLFGPREGLLAGALLLVLAPLYFFEVKLLDPSLSVFLAVLAVFLAVFAESRAHTPAGTRPLAPLGFSVLAGFVAGLLAVVRANLLLFPLLLLGWWGIEALRHRRPGVGVAAYALGLVIALAPVTLHNVSKGAVVPIATSGGFNFYVGNFPGATGVFEDVPGTTGSIATQKAETDSLIRADLGREFEPAAASRYWVARGLREAGREPLRWLGLLGKKVWLFLGRQEQENNGSLEMEASRVPLLRFLALPWNLLFSLAILGGVFAWRRRGEIAWPAPLALLAGTVLTCLVFFVLTRLRLPAAPVLAVFAAHGVIEGVERWRSGERPRLVMMGLALAAFVLITYQSPLSAGRNPLWEAGLVVESAKALEREQDGRGAERAYRLALELDPGCVEALLGRAEHEVARKDLAAAIVSYEAARAIAPQMFRVRNNLGILYFSVGRFQECVREMEEAAVLEPREATPFVYRGLVARAQGAPGWREFMIAAIERDPRQGAAYQALIEDAVAAGDTRAARAWAARAEAAGVGLPPDLRNFLP